VTDRGREVLMVMLTHTVGEIKRRC